MKLSSRLHTHQPGSRTLYRTLFVLCSLFGSSLLHADMAESVFGQYKDRLLQIRIIDKVTNSKSTIGSGFFIDTAGTIATNYHVIARHVFRPKQYRIEFVTHDNAVHEAQLLNIDVIHDLALLRSEATDTPPLELRSQQLNKGVRIYTLGNPLDLGMTIVEGTYNGITDDTMHERILLSGALNPGMSGGPSIIRDGSIVGVNVATAGNSIGFLVPEKFLRKLIDSTRQHRPENFMDVMREQLLTNQEKYIGDLLAQPFVTKQLGVYTVPGRLANYLNCWGDSIDDQGPYTSSDSHCAIKNDIYLNRRLRTGEIRYTHTLLHSEQMNPVRFYNLMQEYFADPSTSLSGNKDDFTDFQCKTDFVEHNSLNFKTAFCVRRYKEFESLYDSILNAATVNESNRGLVTTLVLTGVSFENAAAFARTYLESFAWKPQ